MADEAYLIGPAPAAESYLNIEAVLAAAKRAEIDGAEAGPDEHAASVTAGIAAAGNPAARIMSARITFGYELIPDEPTPKETIRGAEETQAAIEYFRAL